ncbi:MAG: hypothetical protein EXS55_00990 [Candidatus Magasanikbacteria bacterium]|nr:hypothetical protein [Candidatus Magasanikbacteria bacterium]
MTAVFGGLGAVCGDMIVFRFVKNHVSNDFEYIVKSLKKQKRLLFFRSRFWKLKAIRFVIPLLGALIIASPLPDELGLMLLGLSKVRMRVFIPLSFFLNTAGIFIIGIVAKNL